MGRSRKQRPSSYRQYYEKDYCGQELEIPDQTLSNRKRRKLDPGQPLQPNNLNESDRESFGTLQVTQSNASFTASFSRSPTQDRPNESVISQGDSQQTTENDTESSDSDSSCSGESSSIGQGDSSGTCLDHLSEATNSSYAVIHLHDFAPNASQAAALDSPVEPVVCYDSDLLNRVNEHDEQDQWGLCTVEACTTQDETQHTIENDPERSYSNSSCSGESSPTVEDDSCDTSSEHMSEHDEQDQWGLCTVEACTTQDETQHTIENDPERSYSNSSCSGESSPTVEDDSCDTSSEHMSEHEDQDQSGFASNPSFSSDDASWEESDDSASQSLNSTETEHNRSRLNASGEAMEDHLEDRHCDPFAKLEGKMDEFKKQISIRSDISIGEIFLMVLKLSKKHHWSHTETSDVMKLAASISKLGNSLPSSRYLLDSYFYSKIGMEYHFFCSKCSQYLGGVPASSERANRVICPNKNCTFINELKTLLKATYFVTFDVPSQIEFLLQDPEIRRKLLNPADYVEEPSDGIMRDLHHGSSYRSFARYVHEDPSNNNYRILSFSLSVDSASICSFSSLAICPCFLMLNELPAVIRMKNLLIAGLWFGTKKEIMNLYLSPIVNHIIRLSFGFTVNIAGEEWLMKAYLIACVADSVARCDVQGLHSHRGDFPCNWCLVEGDEWERARIFPYMIPAPPLRTAEELKNDADEALKTKLFVNGVKYLCLLAPAPLFHPVDGFIVDQMHCKDEGNTKSFLLAWLDAPTRAAYAINQEAVMRINAEMKKIRPPREVRKSVRDLKDFAFWTGREFENFAFFFSIPLLVNVLPKRYLEHWALYIQGTYILLNAQLKTRSIQIAEDLLNEFCSKVEDLYYPAMMRFNLHILLHFAANARRWGPMFALSAYAFEAGNQYLKKKVHAASYLPSQICRALSEDKGFLLLKNNCETPTTRTFEEKVNRAAQDMKIKAVGNFALIGKPQQYIFTEEEIFLLTQANLPTTGWLDYKFLKKDGCFYGPSPERQHRFDNSFARLKCNAFVKIKKVLHNEDARKSMIISHTIRCYPSPYCPRVVQNVDPDMCFQYCVDSIDEDVCLYDVGDLVSICVCVSVDGQNFLSPMPNIFNMF